ncbi:uncharacterized protein LTR77_000756 [Saxophila tyrrhenica]|uniref:Ubiquitin-like modifier HUB1 n=1 Tax=Saxophila tyrrhenica TaxID=1690608 RepID=A0AAV9PS24_9PEZI|nr:hypothetical protein LTR77_000756 [Saxophila tyrrhenica]
MSDRSASPLRDEPKPKKQKTSGFKWKDKKSKDEDGAESKDSGRLERGYRDRSPRRDRDRDRDQKRDPFADSKKDSYRPRDRSPRKDADDRRTTKPSATTSDTPKDSTTASDKPKEKKKKKSTPASSEPMIIVNINDRLGTKAAIPCLASDSIKAFKAIVAAHIGRQPHEIMLKRQGERPFKDQLTLEDYGVSSGVQLDLELDTGD